MRHSSWTLFLVPLALPLVFLCFPGASKPSHPAASVAAEGQELIIDQTPLAQSQTVLVATSANERTGPRSESLYKD